MQKSLIAMLSGQMVLLAFAGFTSAAGNNLRPVIGILAQHDSEVSPEHMYIAASYVKFLESAGARVVPVLSNLTEADYIALFNGLNGVLFPGGGVNLQTSGYFNAAKTFFGLSVKAFEESNEVFPIWGTCLGFQALTVLAANRDVLIHVDGEDISWPLNFTGHPEPADSRLFGTMPALLIDALRTKPLTYNHHQFGASPHTYATDDRLSSTYDVLSTNLDKNGVPFVSTIEGKKLPFFGIQWHSEKNGFEWNTKEQISHDPDAVRVMQHIADVFVGTAQQSAHQFSSTEDLVSHLIYNWSPIYTGRGGSAYEQTYAWPLRGNHVNVAALVRNLNAIRLS